MWWCNCIFLTFQGSIDQTIIVYLGSMPAFCCVISADELALLSDRALRQFQRLNDRQFRPREFDAVLLYRQRAECEYLLHPMKCFVS